LGHESVVKAGDVQWTTAGRGIVHAEGPTKDFVEKGGTLEGIQLWLNLPADKKMIQANYQHIKNEDFDIVRSADGLANIKVVAGSLNGVEGKIATQTAVNTYMIDLKASGEIAIELDPSHQSLIYLLKGHSIINATESLIKDENQLVEFNQDGEAFTIKASEDSLLLFLSGKPFNEPVSSWGPYVMNTQTEIMEALRDYQMGKMGFLPA